MENTNERFYEVSLDIQSLMQRCHRLEEDLRKALDRIHILETYTDKYLEKRLKPLEAYVEKRTSGETIFD